MKNKKGITLISLIITIIVMLILAGVSVRLLLGEKGIISRATNVKNELEEAQKEETIKLELLGNCWTGEIATNFEKGIGTEEDPYIIKTPEQLAYLAKMVNEGENYEGKYLKIIKSLNLNNIKWTPIAIGGNGETDAIDWKDQRTFNGIIDGGNNVIANLYVDELDRWGVGLFGYLDENGIIKNVQVISGEVKGLGCVGGIVGASKGSIENCINKINVTAIETKFNKYTAKETGGIAGRISAGSINGCKNYGDISSKYSNYRKILWENYRRNCWSFCR